jgi:hypothetical protein
MYIDINWEARTNGTFRHKLDHLISEIDLNERKGSPIALERV